MSKLNVRPMMSALIAISAIGCVENPTAVDSPELSVRMAKPAPPPAPSITVTALGSLPNTVDPSSGAPIALALNNGSSRATTRAAGYTRSGAIRDHPFTWTQASGIKALDLAERRHGWPYGVSDNDVIVGEAGTPAGNRAFIVTPTGPMSFLPVIAGTTFSQATGISADGACISGMISHESGTSAVIWRNGVLEIVGAGSGEGVTNDCLVLAGYSGGRGVVWRNVGGSWTQEILPSAGTGRVANGVRQYSEVTDISPSGEFAAGRRHVDSLQSRAVVWRRTASGWIPTDMPDGTMYAFGVDNRGRAVGHNSAGEPVVWSPASDGTYSAKVLPPLERSTQGWPAAINELGQIAGRSRNRHGWQPVIWTILE